MIPYDLVYLRPSSAAEAVQLFEQTHGEGLEPAYYAGGTETLSFIRHNRIRPGALIDIKEIPECRGAAKREDRIEFGSALCLNEVEEARLFPLLSAACRRIADHTVRNRLTLGGNICGRLPYREAVLPLLAADAEVQLVSPSGSRWESLGAMFEKRLRLRPGELLLRVRIEGDVVDFPAFHGRRERATRVDYPLVTCCLLKTERAIRLAVGGACGYPLREPEAETLLNAPELGRQERIERAVDHYAMRIRDDFRASARYRRFLFARILEDALDTLGGEKRG
jgi:CO/xanthine dehydrogenase FAD-binding subunit